MTKLRWDKADQYDADPAAVVGVPEQTRPERWTPPLERQRKADERAKRNRELQKSSEQHDWELFETGLERRIMEKQERGEPLSVWDKLLLKQREARG